MSDSIGGQWPLRFPLSPQRKQSNVPKPLSLARTLATGFCMGAADVVPGVSGGTVALLAGIYTRLLKAVTRFDRQALSLVKQRDWKALAEHCDFGLIVPLLGSLAFGFVLSALTIKKTLDSDTLRPITLAWFQKLNR